VQADAKAYFFNIFGSINNNGNNGYPIALFSVVKVGARYTYYSNLYHFMGLELSIINVDLVFSRPPVSLLLSFTAPTPRYGFGEMLGKKLYMFLEVTRITAGLAFNIKNKVVLKPSIDFSIDVLERHEEETDEKFLFSYLIGGRFEIDRIGGTPIGIFYSYSLRYSLRKDWIGINKYETVFLQNHLVGIQVSLPNIFSF
jgi:hypothetical protein